MIARSERRVPASSYVSGNQERDVTVERMRLLPRAFSPATPSGDLPPPTRFYDKLTAGETRAKLGRNRGGSCSRTCRF
jgi:hypothetical protein